VVDNASTDETARVVRDEFAAVNLIQLATNTGFAFAVNRGIAAALTGGAEFVIILNQDTHAREDWLHVLGQAVRERGPVGILGPLQANYEGTGICPSTRRSILLEVGDCVDDMWKGDIRLSYRTHLVYGGVMMIHRSVFDVIGLFDENFFMYCEDIDFCRRATRCGIPIWFVPKAVICHHSTMSSVGMARSHVLNTMNRRGWIMLDLKDPQRPLARATASHFRHLLFGLLRNLLAVRQVSIRDCVTDLYWLATHIGRIRIARKHDIDAIGQARRASGTGAAARQSMTTAEGAE
jgi:GT2 family glycosyltransferase